VNDGIAIALLHAEIALRQLVNLGVEFGFGLARRDHTRPLDRIEQGQTLVALQLRAARGGPFRAEAECSRRDCTGVVTTAKRLSVLPSDSIHGFIRTPQVCGRQQRRVINVAGY
jgi:hypothetical protein